MKRPSSPSTPEIPAKTRILNNIYNTEKRKKYAILLMYSGWGYYGMQRSPVYPTIEGELAKALLTCGQLKGVSAEDHRKVYFQRASKTDKNVSAIGQVCSMNLIESSDLVTRLNEHLPENIRILDLIRVTKNFSAQVSCSHRVYDYLLPTFALSPNNLLISDQSEDNRLWNYRIAPEQLVCANDVFKHFQGTHNFYNFTSGREPNDKSCIRYIISIECLDPFLIEDREYVIIRVTGQSFMLHQIRKMIGLMIAVVRGLTTENIFDIVFGTKRVDIPKAPGLGLMLDHVDYWRYNQRFGSDGIHKSIDWTNYEDQTAMFKLNYIYKHIDKTEVEEKSMLQWLPTLFRHTYTFRESASPQHESSETLSIAEQGQEPETEDLLTKAVGHA